MAEPARHADAVRPHQVLRQVIARVAVVTLRVPSLRCRLIEIRVREQAQADHAGRVAVERADRQILAAGTDFHARIFLLVLERVGRTILAALVEPQTEAIRIRRRRLLEARFVDQAEIVPAVVAAELQAWMRGQRLQEIERSDTVGRDCVPEAVVASIPDDPGIASLHLVGCEYHAAVHRVKVVLVGRGEAVRTAVGTPRLVQNLARLRLLLASHQHRRDCSQASKTRGQAHSALRHIPLPPNAPANRCPLRLFPRPGEALRNGRQLRTWRGTRRFV
jgi:hypothetical protein